MKELVRQANRRDEFEIASAATSTEEIGNPVYPPMRELLNKKGISTSGKYARQMTKADYDYYDSIILMDHYNIRNIMYIIGEDTDHKVRLLLDRDVSDPWYTRDFTKAYNDILEGCTALLEEIL